MSSASRHALATVPPPANNWRLKALKGTLKAAVARIERQTSTVATRNTLAALARMAPPPFGAKRSDATLAGVPCRWFAPRDAVDDLVVVHFHGGGFCMCSVKHTHEVFLADYARTTQRLVLGVDYRKAPEHPFPVPIDDCLGVYLALLDQGRDPNRIVLSGDSAGGNLALAVVQRLREMGKPMPRGMVLMSPWVDLEMKGLTLHSNETSDYITRAVLRKFVDAYLGSQDPTQPLASPCHAEFDGFPSMFVQVGGDESMLSEVRWMVCKAQSHGVDARIQEWRGLVHAFQGFSAFLPESVEALKSVRLYLDDIATHPESAETLRRRKATPSGIRRITDV
ncbi:MAG: alpha/beta hydrolase [Polyangiales bacterium]